MVQPSSYQKAVMEWIVTGEGNAIVNAVAGSGKTSTAVMAADLLPTDARSAFLAFNKSIADELKNRLPKHVEAATFHSLCSRPLRVKAGAFGRSRDWVQKNKVHNILDTLTDEYGAQVGRVRNGVVKLVGLMKANALLPDCDEAELLDIIEAHNIEFSDEDTGTAADVTTGIEIARKALAINNQDLKVIDFDDMLYLTYIMRLPLMRYDYLFVDEAQDTNKVQRLLIGRMIGKTGRLIAVGDPFQAIYGFRGADANAMNAIRDEFECTELPLSISYRCPASVIAAAKRIVPHIEARDNAPEGTVSTLDTWNLDDFNALDLVVCRNVAPLVTLAFRFIRARKPVKMMGRDIGEGLIALVKKMRATNLEDLAERIDEWAKRETMKAIAKRQDARVQQIQDQQESIIAICEGMPEDSRTIYDVISTISTLFTDQGNGNRTTLSTIHKAKGKEAHRVFILDPHLMPSKWAKQPWQQVQERNLRYVAITRALDTLHYVQSEAIR